MPASRPRRGISSANARIGVAKAAYFPVVSLTGNGGYVSAEFNNLFDWSSRIWSIGPSISRPIFAQARNRANVLVNWGWNYLTYDRGARLILETTADDDRP